MIKNIRRKLGAALLIASLLFSQQAYAQIPVIDMPSLFSGIETLINGIKESAFLKNTIETLSKVSKTLGGIKSTISEFLAKKDELLNKIKDAKAKYDEKIGPLKDKYNEYSRKVKDSIQKAKDLKNKVEDGINKARDEVNKVKDQVQDGINKVKDVKNQIEDGVQQVKNEVQNVKDQVQNVKDKVQEVKGQVQDGIQQVKDAKGQIQGAVQGIKGQVEDKVGEVKGQIQGVTGGLINEGQNTEVNSNAPADVVAEPEELSPTRQPFGYGNLNSNLAVPTNGEPLVNQASTVEAAPVAADKTVPNANIAAPQAKMVAAPAVNTTSTAVKTGVAAAPAAVKVNSNVSTTTPAVQSAPVKNLRRAFTTSSLEGFGRISTNTSTAFASVQDACTDANGVNLLPESICIYCGLGSEDVLKDGVIDECMRQVNTEREKTIAEQGNISASKVYNDSMVQSAAAVIAESYRAASKAETFYDDKVAPIFEAPAQDEQAELANMIEFNKVIDEQLNGLIYLYASKVAMKMHLLYGDYQFKLGEEL